MVAANGAVLHIRFDGRSTEIPLGDLDVGALTAPLINMRITSEADRGIRLQRFRFSGGGPCASLANRPISHLLD